MMQQKATLNDFAPGSEAYVRGRVRFGRIASHIAGEELKKDQKRKEAINREPIKDAYTTMTIFDPVILSNSPTKTDFECFLEKHRFYQATKSGGELRFEAMNKNPKGLPKVMHFQPTSNTYEPKELQADLAEGSEVILRVKVYKPQAYKNHGMALEAVMILDQEIKYYQPSTDIAAALAERGFTMTGMQQEAAPPTNPFPPPNQQTPPPDAYVPPQYPPNTYVPPATAPHQIQPIPFHPPPHGGQAPPQTFYADPVPPTGAGLSTGAPHNVPPPEGGPGIQWDLNDPSSQQ